MNRYDNYTTFVILRRDSLPVDAQLEKGRKLSDYHLLPGSATIGVGLDGGVLTDLDGEARPWGNGFEIGADECYLPALAVYKHACCDSVQSGALTTYRWSFARAYPAPGRAPAFRRH
ncbi:MAG: hypothetical protein JXA93_03860 [Anaerolineae bacterium]|nr:hypothetical protein [Anaerolineae bacterium]